MSDRLEVDVTALGDRSRDEATAPDGTASDAAPDMESARVVDEATARDGAASDVLVREATPTDAGTMVVLRAVMMEAMGLPAEQVADPAWRRAAHGWFTAHVGDAGVRVVVAEVAGEVVAGAVGEVTSLIPGPTSPYGSVGLMSNVATLPQHRGRGLASAVADDLLAWFVERTDVSRVDLFATPGGARLYESRGFTVRGFPGMCRPVERGGA